MFEHKRRLMAPNLQHPPRRNPMPEARIEEARIVHAELADNNGAISDDELARNFSNRNPDFRYVAPFNKWFVFTGTLLWSILIDALNAPLLQVNANKALLAKINFPREALIVSGVYQTLFNAAIKLGILLLVLPFLGVHPGLGGLLIPLGLLSLVLTGTALGLLITPLGVLYGDIGRGIPLITQFLMFLSPVVFPLASTGWTATLMRLNPLTPLILNARAWFTGQPPELLGEWALALGGSALLLLLVWLVYRLAMPILIERMSA
ncbi:MAG: ABC transporter permease [Rhodobacteraceae bacterium]|nr:ABC transporter permease [Paracoccaceae bacterium]